jgi:hypothetical protein
MEEEARYPTFFIFPSCVYRIPTFPGPPLAFLGESASYFLSGVGVKASLYGVHTLYVSLQ